MKQRRQTAPWSLLICAAWLLAADHRAVADDDPAAQWQATAESRLKAIYQRHEFRAKRIAGTWLADSSGYTLQERDSENDRDVIVQYDVQTGHREVVRPVERKRRERPRYPSPDGTRVLEVRDRNLFLGGSDSRPTRLTEEDGSRDVWFRKVSWSPDGKRIVLVETDESNIRFRPMLLPVDPTYPKVQNRRFARVGEVIASLRVGVIDVEEKSVTWMPIDSPPEGQYFGQVEWAANSNELVVEKLSRFRDRREFLLIDVDSQAVKTIYSESDSAWCLSSQEKNSGLMWINDGQSFVVISEKDGWRHAYLYSREGEEEAVLTPGDYDIIDRAKVDGQQGWFYFYASPDNATQSYLFRVPLSGEGTLERITPEDQPGSHRYNLSPDAQWAIHTWSAFDRPPTMDLVELPSHRHVRVLEDNRELRERFQQTNKTTTEFLQIELGDEVTMDAWIIKPQDFDETNKYPVLVYVYGEPHSQTVLDQWGTSHADFHRLIAELGYVVVSIDNRGTPAPKGAAWRRAIYGSLGPLSTDDQAAALRQLARLRPYLDLDRVAIWGWSGGGSNTLNAMFRKPDLYRVGIAVVPKPQPHLYNAWFQEIYMRIPEVNPVGYKRSAPIHFAEGLQGDLLIVTGSGETNTHIQIVEGLVDRLIELGKPFDYMVYPNRNHGLWEGKGTPVHLRMLMTRYLVEHLPRGPVDK